MSNAIARASLHVELRWLRALVGLAVAASGVGLALLVLVPIAGRALFPSAEPPRDVWPRIGGGAVFSADAEGLGVLPPGDRWMDLKWCSFRAIETAPTDGGYRVELTLRGGGVIAWAGDAWRGEQGEPTTMVFEVARDPAVWVTHWERAGCGG